jgi:hypothetical protein
MGVMELGGEADLVEKALPAEDGRQLGAEHLDGDFALVLEVVGEVDRGHAAPTDLLSRR